MFKTIIKRSKPIVAICVEDNGYSISSISDNKRLLFSEWHGTTDKLSNIIDESLLEDVERLKILGANSKVVMGAGQYQLLLMDAIDVPLEEMAKALKWRLKGLIDYPINDISMDIFPVPAHGAAKQRKKVFVAVTSLPLLNIWLNRLESAYLNVNSVSIAELSLRNILAISGLPQHVPILAISLQKQICQLHVFYHQCLYLVRELGISLTHLTNDPAALQNILLEIQRSMDYCLSELKLPEPKVICFTPGFYQNVELIDSLKTELNKEVVILDLNKFLVTPSPLSMEEQEQNLRSIGAALSPPEAIVEEESA